MAIGQQQRDYQRIEKAIWYLCEHFREQPSLERIAKEVHVSPYHFQRMFTAWAGVSPKKFMQYLSLSYAKQLLQQRATVLTAAYETGFSGTSRLHDLFVSIEGITPGEFKQGGEGLTLRYSYAESPFGMLMVASTPKGVCHMHFEDDKERALENLQRCFPNAVYEAQCDQHQQSAMQLFQGGDSTPTNIKLHLAGTPFQLKVWESLLRIPQGALTSYGDIAEHIGKPDATRAVGTAIGRNPIAYIIPCHRVIQASGGIGGYMWGEARKRAILGWEAAKACGAD